MKKFLCVFFVFVLATSCFLYGCKKNEFSLDNYLYELKENIYEGESESYKVKADYGFIKNENGDKIYELKFKLKNITDTNVNYTVCFDIGEKSYQQEFTFSPIQNVLMAVVEVDCFNNQSLDIVIKKASDYQNISLCSIVPKDTINYKTALDFLYKQQKTYVDSFIVDGVFKGKLTQRIVAKDDKGYYYIGIENEKGNLKAMLIDGTTGELLAIRDVFE